MKMPDAIDRRIVRAMQEGLPLVPRPYEELARKVGIDEETFLARLEAMKESGALRRMGAVLQHRRAGFLANALCVWRVPEDRVDAAGAGVSREKAVSHCYTRAVVPDWPYNFYAMIHAKDRAGCEAIADRLERENELGARRTFYSVREWKKATMQYFCEEPTGEP
ncbi:MAG: AsnC family transcriptional regulator [Schwartzia sp.]|nr:AsnC family transcriptional regulator [Schwartzia sp. (in: firmicutes)]